MSVFTGMITKENLKLRSQAFSGTDLDRQIDNPGIVYPIQRANDGVLTPSISSIVDHENGNTILAHSEYRLVFNHNNETCYIKGRCFSIVNDDTIVTHQSDCEGMLGIIYSEVANQSYLVKEVESPNAKEFFDLEELLSNLDYEPDFIIDENNLTEKKKEFPLFTPYSGNLWESDFINEASKTKKPTRKELEECIKDLRFKYITKCNSLGFSPLDLDPDRIYYITENLKDLTHEELMLVCYELEDMLADLDCGII